jgi:hypothetical protein
MAGTPASYSRIPYTIEMVAYFLRWLMKGLILPKMKFRIQTKHKNLHFSSFCKEKAIQTGNWQPAV